MNDDQENPLLGSDADSEPAEMAPQMPPTPRKPVPFAFVPGWLRGLILGFFESWF